MIETDSVNFSRQQSDSSWIFRDVLKDVTLTLSMSSSQSSIQLH